MRFVLLPHAARARLCECGFAAFLSAFRLLRCILAFGLRHLGVDLRIRRSSPGGALTANRQQRSALARTPTFSRSIPSTQGKTNRFFKRKLLVFSAGCGLPLGSRYATRWFLDGTLRQLHTRTKNTLRVDTYMKKSNRLDGRRDLRRR